MSGSITKQVEDLLEDLETTHRYIMVKMKLIGVTDEELDKAWTKIRAYEDFISDIVRDLESDRPSRTHRRRL